MPPNKSLEIRIQDAIDADIDFSEEVALSEKEIHEDIAEEEI